MPRRSEFDTGALAGLVRAQNGVLSYRQALECRMTPAVFRYRVRDGGPWRMLLPGVCLASSGLPAVEQRDMAAVLYAGPAGMITGLAGLWFHGIQSPQTDMVDVLVPMSRRGRDVGFVRLHPTTRMPEESHCRHAIRYAPLPRAIADTARLLTDTRQVRAIVADAVQRRRCSPQSLTLELNGGPMQGSARLRLVLTEIADGVRSVAEAELRLLIKRARLPDPMYNPRLLVGDTFVASPDCWWPEAGVAAEVDSREWHLSPEQWERTMARHTRMSGYGIIVLHFTPSQIRSRPREVADALRSALVAASGRAPLPIRAVPAR